MIFLLISMATYENQRYRTYENSHFSEILHSCQSSYSTRLLFWWYSFETRLVLEFLCFHTSAFWRSIWTSKAVDSA